MLRIFRHYMSASSVLLFSWEYLLLLGIFYALIPIALTHSPNFSYAPALFVTSLLQAGMTSALLGMLGTYDKWHLGDHFHVARRLIISFI
ncbi:MAG: hypothetical protein HY246_25820, partial [Proteobacteria bacterium]|nr:hypothetical protein [Pseudomonadota bacterium]